MRLKPTIWPTVETMKRTEPEDRLEVAIGWIDSTIRDFEIHEGRMSGKQLLAYFRNCKKQWDRLVDHDFEILDEGHLYTLQHDTYPSVFAQRLLEVPTNPDQETRLREALREVYNYFGWEADDLEEV
jgi:hypothetical protein